MADNVFAHINHTSRLPATLMTKQQQQQQQQQQRPSATRLECVLEEHLASMHVACQQRCVHALQSTCFNSWIF
jgi:hypothetical protein